MDDEKKQHEQEEKEKEPETSRSGLDPPGLAHGTPNLDARWGPAGVKICLALSWLPQDPPAGRQT